MEDDLPLSAVSKLLKYSKTLRSQNDDLDRFFIMDSTINVDEISDESDDDDELIKTKLLQ